MTNAYPFLPITLKSVLIVLFDNIGLDLNLLDPFYFKFHYCALKAQYQALSYKFDPLCSTAFKIKVRLVSRGCQRMAVLLCVETLKDLTWKFEVEVSKSGMCHAPLSFSYILKPNSEELCSWQARTQTIVKSIQKSWWTRESGWITFGSSLA